jgi:hypothetical protein
MISTLPSSYRNGQGNLAGVAGRKEATPAFYKNTPAWSFREADNRSGFEGLPPEGASDVERGCIGPARMATNPALQLRKFLSNIVLRYM